jgi:hypothetical protein
MFKIIESAKNNYIALLVEGLIDENEFQKIKALLEKTKNDIGKIKLLVEIKGVRGINAVQLLDKFQDFLLEANLFDKVAIIGWYKYDEDESSSNEVYLREDIAFFDEKKRATAKEWVTSE